MNGHLQLRPFCFPGPDTVLLDYDGISFMEQQASGLHSLSLQKKYLEINSQLTSLIALRPS